MPGTQICGRHVEVFGRTSLYLVLCAKIAPGRRGGVVFLTYDLYFFELVTLIT